MSIPHGFDTAMQLPEVLLTLTNTLDHVHYAGDVERAAQDPEAFEVWAEAEPEVRACILLSAAWSAGRGPAPSVGDDVHVAGYVEDFHKYAAAFGADQSEAFHGRAFPAMPLPGQAGALASSLAFDRDDLAISLRTALVLLDAGRKAER